MERVPKQDLFESSKLRQFRKVLRQEASNHYHMSADELVAQVAHQALAEAKEHIYWSEKTQALARLAMERVAVETDEKRIIVKAKLARNQAQIIIQDPQHDQFDKAIQLLYFARAVFQSFEMKAEALFTEDEILHTDFKRLVKQQGPNQEANLRIQIPNLHQSWLDLLASFEELLEERPEENQQTTIWYRNAVRHFLEFCSCYGLAKHGYVRVAMRLFKKDNPKKMLECGLYGLGYLGYQIAHLL